ncbi:microtubule-associated protein futsch-like [Schistocerca americana]|uniref:microtubule-associated protein futsch-like n=1 Tax=Schistocerca americana TaxID=7009 RepID=UPI001F4FDA53|nr:microtubule-associated protein futsch-like [Schistocerca americana]
MSNFSANGLNAWRLTRRESRLFPPDSLKFHSFVVETGSKLRCGRKDSPQARKGRRSAGEELAARQLTYCCCHVENSDITSAVKFRSGSPTCVPDCGCCLEETCDETVGLAAFVPEKDHQVRQIRCAMKRRASSDPRPRKVAKVSVRQLAVTNKRNSVNTKGITQLQPSVIKDSDVAISSNSLSSQPRNQKTGKGKLSAERLPLFWKPSVQLQRLPAEIVKCYLSRPTVVLSRLPDSLFQCQAVSSKEKVPITAASAPEKRLNADSKLKDQKRKKLKRNDLSILDRVKTRNTEAVNADGNTKSAKEETPVISANKSRLCSKSETKPEELEKQKKSNSSNLRTTDNDKDSSTKSVSAGDDTNSPQKGALVISGSESRTRSKSEPRPEDLEKQKKSSSGLRTVDKVKSSSTNTIHADVNTKSARKVEVPAISGRESRTRSKSDLRPDELEKRKRSSSGLRTEDKVRSRSANSVHADVNMNSVQKVTRQAVASQNALSPVRNLRSNSPKKPERKMYRNAGEVVIAEVKDVHSKSTSAGTHKAEDQTKWRRSKSAEAIFNGAQNEVKSDLASVAADKLEEQVSCHPVTRHSTSSASALSNSLQPKFPSKSGGLSVEERNYFPQLKVTRLLELTNNNRSAATIDELVQEMCSPTSANVPPKNSEITPEEKPLKRNVRRPRRDETGSGLPVESPEDCKENGVTSGDKNPALEIHSPASAGTPQKDSETTLEEKSLKRKRGRQRQDETGSGPSVEKSEDHRHDEVTSRDKNDAALEIHSPALVDTPHKDSETTLEEKSLKRRRGRPRRDETGSGPSVEKSEDHKHDGVTSGDKNAALEQAPVTAINVPEKRCKTHSKPEDLERKKKTRNDLSTMDRVKLCNMEAVNADNSNKSSEEEPTTTLARESGRRSKSESRPEELENQKKSSSGFRTVEKIKSTSTDSVNAHVSRKSAQKEAPMTSARESRRRSKSGLRPDDLERRKRSSSDLGTEDHVKSPITNLVHADGDRTSAQKRAPTTSVSIQGKRFKADQVPEDLERKKKRRNNQSTMDQAKSHDTEEVNADSSKKSTQEEALVTAANKSRHRSKSETRPEELEKRTRSSSGLKTVDKNKSSPAESVKADDNRNSAHKEAPVTAANKSRHRSKSETRPEELEKRTRSSSGLKTMDKEKSSPAVDNRNSAHKEPPVTSPRESRRRSMSVPRPEGLGKRKRSSSRLRTEGKVKSPSTKSVIADDSRKSAQKETPVTSVRESRRRSKSEPRAKVVEKRKRSSSGLRTEGKTSSASGNSFNANVNRTPTQKETPVASASEPRRRSKSEPRLENRKGCSNDQMTEEKVRSPSRNSVNADINRKSAQKETSVTSGSKSRRRSKSESRPETLEGRNRQSSVLMTLQKAKSPSRDVVNGDVVRKSPQKETSATSGSESRPHSKSEVISEALERRNTQISDLATPDKVNSTSRDLVNGDINWKSVQKETSATSGHDSKQYSNSEMRPEALERRSTYISDLAIPYKVKSTSRDMVNGDINRKSVQKQSSGTSTNSSQIHSELVSREERQKKRVERSNECQTQITMMNGGEENFSIPVVGANENSTQKILPKAAAQADMSVLSNNKHHYPDQGSKLLNKIPTKLERLKAKICQNTSVNKLQDVTSNFLYGGDSNVRTRQKMLESLAPSPSCRSVRSMLSESRTSLNSLSSEGTEFESPAYEPLGSSPIFMQNLRDEHEEIQKTKVISPSCRSDCCSLRQPQELTSPPLKIQMQNKTAVRRLSDVFDAVPSTSKGAAAHRKMAEEQRLKCLVAAEDDGNVVPCHEVDASFYEEWTKRVREADRKAEAGFAPKYSKKYKGRKETFDEMPTPSDDGKELILSQKLSSTSPMNCKQQNVVPNKLALLGWKDLHSPSNCVPSNKSPATRPLNTSDGGTNDSEEDCIITDVRLCSSPSSVLHKTPPLGIRKNSSTSTTVTGQRNLGKSLTDIRPEQQIGESNELTVVGVNRTSSARKWQHCNKSQFQSSAFSACHCRSKRVQRRCRSASPRLCSVNDYYRTEDDDDEDDDDFDDDKYDFDPVTRLQQINKQIELLENSTPQVNPLWRRKTRNRASLLEGNGVNKIKSDGYQEDSEDDDKSVIILDERNPCFSPRSPSYTPPDLRAKRSSPEQCGSLTVENVAKHNNFLKNSISGPSSSSSLSLCGLSDSDDGASVCCVSRGMVTPRKGLDREPSFTEASTPRTNGVSPCLSPTTKSRSRCSSRNEDNSRTDLPTCSATKTHTVIGQRNGAEMIHLFASPASCVTDEVSPVLNKRRNPPFKGSVNSAKHNGLLDSVSKDPEVPLRGHSSQLVTPSLSAARMATVFCHRTDGVQEIEDCLSQENDINSMNEKESVRRNLKTPTELHVRRLSSLSPMETCYGPPSSPGEQSSECSMERRHSVSSMEKSMLLHLFDEIRTMPQLEKGIERDEEEDSVSAGNVSICVDGSQSSGESDDLDAECRDTDAEVVAEGFGLQITRGDLATLSGTNWLNDKIVNFYLKLLTERGRQNREPEVYAYDTFFFPKLIKCGYESVKKWTRVVDVFKHDILIIPVHLGTHWCMAAVDFRKQTLVYYDSMGGENESCLKTIWSYLNEECAQRSVEPLSEEIWQIRCAKDIPKQSNNSDCGVFMCKYAECITRDAKLEFSQNDMPEIRMEMMEEIQTMTLLHP